MALTVCGAAAVLAGLGAAHWRRAAARTAARTAAWMGFEVNGMHYEVLLPRQYDRSRRYPVLLYLHQLSMGNYRKDLLRQVDAWFNAETFRMRYPAIVVVPMLDQRDDPSGDVIHFGGKQEGHVGEENTLAALRRVMDRYLVDVDRIYVTGTSMGGIGTWQMLLDYNALTGTKGRIFAAGMPVAGTNRKADPAAAANALRGVPIWAIHGALDKEVTLDWDRAMARLLSDSPSFRYSEVSGAPHEIWDAYYARPEVWDWLFAQRGGN